MDFLLTSLMLLLLWPDRVESHARWGCPKPRSPDTGIKSGPCGPETNDFSVTPSIQISPGPMRVMLEESIHHTGAPFRISLSQDGTDTGAVCILVDHIPHNDGFNPNIADESTYTPYYLTIIIPDVSCDRCSLHLANIMTDKIGDSGAPKGEGCTDPDGTCFSVYHSCTVPLTITGSTPRAEWTCPNSNPTDWPVTWWGDGGVSVDAKELGVYRRESATWTNGLLMDAPEQYRQDAIGTLCSSSNAFPTTGTPTNPPSTSTPTSNLTHQPSNRAFTPTNPPSTMPPSASVVSTTILPSTKDTVTPTDAPFAAAVLVVEVTGPPTIVPAAAKDPTTSGVRSTGFFGATFAVLIAALLTLLNPILVQC
jgi:hypothetical protein